MRKRLIALLLVGAATLVAVLFSNMQEGRFLKIERVVPLSTHVSGTLSGMATTSMTTVLEGPRYTGQDLAGQAWQIVATRATQTGALNTSAVLLEDVTATWINPGGPPLSMVARQAVYLQATEQLNVQGEITLTRADLTLSAPSITVLVVKRTAAATGGVQVQGVLGQYNVNLTGAEAKAAADGVVTLRGQVKARLVPRSKVE